MTGVAASSGTGMAVLSEWRQLDGGEQITRSERPITESDEDWQQKSMTGHPTSWL
jgi:hypothetical protein